MWSGQCCRFSRPELVATRHWPKRDTERSARGHTHTCNYTRTIEREIVTNWCALPMRFLAQVQKSGSCCTGARSKYMLNGCISCVSVCCDANHIGLNRVRVRVCVRACVLTSTMHARVCAISLVSVGRRPCINARIYSNTSASQG